MLCVMHMSPKYGYLLNANGTAFTVKQIGVLGHMEEAQCSVFVSELETVGVFSRNESGIIYCRKMLRDEKQRRQWRKWTKNHRDREGKYIPDVRAMSGQSQGDVNRFPSPSPIPKELNTRSAAKSAAQRATIWPEGFLLTEDLRQYALAHNTPLSEWEHFENHHRAKGSRFVDWGRAWKSWVQKGKKFKTNEARWQTNSQTEVGRASDPQSIGVRVNPAALERIRRREAEREQKRQLEVRS